MLLFRAHANQTCSFLFLLAPQSILNFYARHTAPLNVLKTEEMLQFLEQTILDVRAREVNTSLAGTDTDRYVLASPISLGATCNIDAAYFRVSSGGGDRGAGFFRFQGRESAEPAVTKVDADRVDLISSNGRGKIFIHRLISVPSAITVVIYQTQCPENSA